MFQRYLHHICKISIGLLTVTFTSKTYTMKTSIDVTIMEVFYVCLMFRIQHFNSIINWPYHLSEDLPLILAPLLYQKEGIHLHQILQVAFESICHTL